MTTPDESISIRPEHVPIEEHVTNAFPSDAREQLGERLYNLIITHVPSGRLRVAWLRAFGAHIGRGSHLDTGSRVLGLKQLSIGENCVIGASCLLDARGSLVLDDDVVFGPHVHTIGGVHMINSNDFRFVMSPIHIGHHAVVRARVTLLPGVDIGDGAVIVECALVRDDVPAMAVASGIPAKPTAVRESALRYHPTRS